MKTLETKPAGWYDAAFMDVMMSVIGGYEATAAIRVLPARTPAEHPREHAHRAE
ncbi:MAG: hypothetical protein IJO87_06140 [Eggerthellaceae bacterium]|nr:hypothetical protein [Eggerthellaceae bacterium]